MGGVTARRRRDRGGFFVYRIRSRMMEAVDFVCACEILQSIGSLFVIYSLYSTYVTLLVYSLFHIFGPIFLNAIAAGPFCDISDCR